VSNKAVWAAGERDIGAAKTLGLTIPETLLATALVCLLSPGAEMVREASLIRPF
jgi:hypothetical protein